jgi:hypothetical protein
MRPLPHGSSQHPAARTVIVFGTARNWFINSASQGRLMS